MKIYPKQPSVREIRKVAGISKETLYREVRRILKVLGPNAEVVKNGD
jgi:transposase-like protein